MARKEPQINIRLSEDLKAKLHALAEKNKRSVNAEVVAAIEEALIKDAMNTPALPGAGGMILSARSTDKFYTPREILEEVARMAAEQAVGLERSPKK
ncbi:MULTISPECIES: Arc family DNA-binding protein [Dickeya]|uniref:Arc family DNA-binding protein n=1 Tax=Dickeya TaxID=204037 RepID=UPI000B139E3C|nr:MULTISPECIES: Arc family DNA-binding protein [Dickeya]MBP2844089.1 Arc family DNA-binding protein [Dickeya oryzae]